MRFDIAWLPDPTPPHVKRCSLCGAGMPPSYDEFIAHMERHRAEIVEASVAGLPTKDYDPPARL